MTLLALYDLTVVEEMGEVDAVMATLTTVVKGSLVDVTEAQRLATYGAIPAGTVFAFLDPKGYGTLWGTTRIVTISDGTRTVNVNSVTPIINPRTRKLDHIEASGGV